jgi:hypothetical protein
MLDWWPSARWHAGSSRLRSGFVPQAQGATRTCSCARAALGTQERLAANRIRDRACQRSVRTPLSVRRGRSASQASARRARTWPRPVTRVRPAPSRARHWSATAWPAAACRSASATRTAPRASRASLAAARRAMSRRFARRSVTTVGSSKASCATVASCVNARPRTSARATRSAEATRSATRVRSATTAAARTPAAASATSAPLPAASRPTPSAAHASAARRARARPTQRADLTLASVTSAPALRRVGSAATNAKPVANERLRRCSRPSGWEHRRHPHCRSSDSIEAQCSAWDSQSPGSLPLA